MLPCDKLGRALKDTSVAPAFLAGYFDGRPSLVFLRASQWLALVVIPSCGAGDLIGRPYIAAECVDELNYIPLYPMACW